MKSGFQSEGGFKAKGFRVGEGLKPRISKWGGFKAKSFRVGEALKPGVQSQLDKHRQFSVSHHTASDGGRV